MTKKLLGRFKKIGVQSRKNNPTVVAKYFTPDSNWTWYATEYNEEERMFFGLVDGFEAELGYFSLDELENIRGKMGLPIERDLYFDERPLNEVRQELAERKG